MVITILDAEVKENNWGTLKEAYRSETSGMPEGIHQTFLIQSQDTSTYWRIMTHWRSQEDLDKVRNSPETPPAVRVFQAADAKPQLALWNIEIHRVNKNSDLFQ
ncbi:MAG TPA: antibiotic biosynthesis monooxygenase [Candidatus Saccharimonadales bacterium]